MFYLIILQVFLFGSWTFHGPGEHPYRELQTLGQTTSGKTETVQYELKWKKQNPGSLEEAGNVLVVFFSFKKSISQSLFGGRFMDQEPYAKCDLKKRNDRFAAGWLTRINRY